MEVLNAEEGGDIMTNFRRWKTLVIPDYAEEIVGLISNRLSNSRTASTEFRLQTLQLVDDKPEPEIMDEVPDKQMKTIGQIFLRRNPITNHQPLDHHRHLPSLKSLTLWSIRCSIGGSLQNVRKLDLCVFAWQSWASFQAALSETHHLETLRMTSMPSGVTDGPLLPLYLPHVRDLTIGKGSHESFLASWFLNTTTSNLRGFTFELSRRSRKEDTIIDWLETFVRSFLGAFGGTPSSPHRVSF